MIRRKLAHDSFYEAVFAQDGQHVERLVPPRSTPATLVREVAAKIVDSPSGLLIVVGQNGGVNAVITLHDILRAQTNFANNQQD